MISMAVESTANSEQESTRAAWPVIFRNRALGPREAHLSTLQWSPTSCTCATAAAPARKLKPCTTVLPLLAVRQTPAVPLVSVPSQTADRPMNCKFETLETTFS